MNFYILMTHGAKPRGSFLDHPAAVAQIQLCRQFCGFTPNAKPRYFGEYTRKVSNMAALPKLNTVLQKCLIGGLGVVFMDDVARIFRIAPLATRVALFDELQVYGKHLYSIRHRKKLQDFTPAEINLLLLHAEKSKPSAKRSYHGDTEKARSASIISRSDRSKKIIQEINMLQRELLDKHGSATLQMVADEANSRGIRTSQGKEWSRQTVGKALK